MDWENFALCTFETELYSENSWIAINRNSYKLIVTGSAVEEKFLKKCFVLGGKDDKVDSRLHL